MRVNSVNLLGALFAAMASYAQPNIDWQRNFGGGLQDRAYSVVTTSDGGYIVLGETRSSDGIVEGFHGGVGSDIWLVKLDHTGAIDWQRCLGGTGAEIAGEVAQTLDGGYILVGSTASQDGEVSENFGGSDVWLVRLTATGDLIWEKSFGGSDNDSGERIGVQEDGTFSIGATTFSMDGDAIDSHGASDFWVGRVSEEGVLLNSQCYGGSRFEYLRDMDLSDDGGVIIGGVTNSIDGDVVDNPIEENQAWVFHLSDGWELTWQTILGGLGDDQVRGLFMSQGDTVIVAISSDSQQGDITDPFGEDDYWIVKLGPDGTLVRQRSFGGSGQDLPFALAPGESPLTFYVAGRSSSNDGVISAPRGATDCWILHLNSELDLLWETSIGGTEGDGGNALCLSTDGGLVVGGYSLSNDVDLTSNFGLSDVWVVKFEPQDVGLADVLQHTGLRIFPNPTSDVLSLAFDEVAHSFSVYDAQGKLIASLDGLPAGQRQHQLNVAAWAEGLYTVQLNGEGTRQVRRFAKH